MSDTNDLVERLRFMKDEGLFAAAACCMVADLGEAADEITRLRADSERLQKIEGQMDGGRFDEWPTATFVGQLRMQSRDSLDPEYSQFMAATATHLGLLSGQYDAQREIAERAKEEAARLRAHCEALAKALGGMVDAYTALVNSGDAGFWDPEKDEPVVAARAALAACRKENPDV